MSLAERKIDSVDDALLLEYVEHSGLCSTCKHAKNCMYLKNATDPVIQCEEFKNIDPPHLHIVRHDHIKKKTDIPENPEKYKGLCLNCEHKTTCNLPKPVGGVWYCEEYE